MKIARNGLVCVTAFIAASTVLCCKRPHRAVSRSTVPPAAVNAASVSAVEQSKQIPGGYTPQYALEEAERYTHEFLVKNSKSASGLNYRFFYNNNGDACLEYTVTLKSGYTSDSPTWTGYSWGSIDGSIGDKNIYYTLTKKNADEAQYRLEERRKDPAFREIEQIVFKIASEYDYDFYALNRQNVKYRDPYVKKAVCEGYADAVIASFANHYLVSSVEKWSSEKGNHAWNRIVLKDGRKIYCDATWYDGTKIDDEGYVVHVPAQNPVDLTFDEDEFNSLGGAIDKKTGGLLAVHFAWHDAALVN
jgi:hypothetical protein